MAVTAAATVFDRLAGDDPAALTLVAWLGLLLPHVLAVTDPARRVGTAAADTGWLLQCAPGTCVRAVNDAPRRRCPATRTIFVLPRMGSSRSRRGPRRAWARAVTVSREADA